MVHRDPEAQRHLVGPRKTSSSRGRQAFYVISEASYTRSTWCLHGLDDCNRVRGRVFRLRVLHELDQIDRAARKLHQPLQLRGLFKQAATTAGQAATRRWPCRRRSRSSRKGRRRATRMRRAGWWWCDDEMNRTKIILFWSCTHACITRRSSPETRSIMLVGMSSRPNARGRKIAARAHVAVLLLSIAHRRSGKHATLSPSRRTKATKTPCS